MRRYLTLLGVSLAVVVGICSAAGAASAAMFEADKYPAEIEANQEGVGVFKVETAANMTATEITCPVARATGEITEPSETITLHPEYEGSGGTPCKAFGLNATVTTTGCYWEVTALTSTTARIDLICASGNRLTAVAATCEVSTDSQANIAGLKTLVNNSSLPATVNLNLALSNMRYTITKDGIGCPLRQSGGTPAPPMVAQDQTYGVNLFVQARKNQIQVGFRVFP